jgi:hypothetical protein
MKFEKSDSLTNEMEKKCADMSISICSVLEDTFPNDAYNMSLCIHVLLIGVYYFVAGKIKTKEEQENFLNLLCDQMRQSFECEEEILQNESEENGSTI